MLCFPVFGAGSRTYNSEGAFGRWCGRMINSCCIFVRKTPTNRESFTLINPIAAALAPYPVRIGQKPDSIYKLGRQ